MTQTYLAKDRFQHPIQALKPDGTQSFGFITASSSAMGTSLNGNTVVIRLVATADCYVSIGPSGSAAATSASMYLPAYSVEYFRVDQATNLRVAALGVFGAGNLNVTEMA